MENPLPSWEILFHTLGENLEDAGKFLKENGVELEIKHLQDTRDGLLATADALDQRIKYLKAEQ